MCTLAVNLYKRSKFGYRRKTSTVDSIIQIIEKLRENDQFFAIVCSSNSDTLNHERLIMKLQRYGIKGAALKWFESYIEGRKQFLQINETMSQHKV